MTSTALYRHFDADGVLVYVGISLNAVQRLSTHAGSPWAQDIRNITIEMHPTRRAALAAEAKAIREEKPLRNSINETPSFSAVESDIMSAIISFCARHDMPKTRFGELALNDPSFVTEIEAGREPRRKTVARVAAFISEYPATKQGAA